MSEEVEPILTVEDITLTFDDIVAVDTVSLELPREKLVAIIGPNGSGKTTLLRMMAGLVKPDRGTISRLDDGPHRQNGYLPQEPRFRQGFTTRETLTFYTRIAGSDPSVVESLLEVVGLTQASSMRVEELSGGMLGLLGIAQSLVGDPPLTILDEPTTGLDPGMRRHVFEVIDGLVEDGRGVVIASHDLELVERHADVVGILDGGRLVAEGSPEVLMEEYEADSLDAVFDTVTEIEGAVTVRRGGT